jgi:hypothetical protein
MNASLSPCLNKPGLFPRKAHGKTTYIAQTPRQNAILAPLREHAANQIEDFWSSRGLRCLHVAGNGTRQARAEIARVEATQSGAQASHFKILSP